jgi:hypothetical protein
LVTERRELRADFGIPGLGGQVLKAFVRLPEEEEEDAPQFAFRAGGHFTHGRIRTVSYDDG